MGFGREHDAAPEVWFKPMKAGARELLPLMDYYKQKIITRADTEHMLDVYYEIRGWDRDTGAPLPEKLKALGLEKFTIER